jgi:hypothetical protein
MGSPAQIKEQVWEHWLYLQIQLGFTAYFHVTKAIHLLLCK